MADVAVAVERERVIRWMEEGRNVLEIVVKFLSEFDQLKQEAETAEKENEQVRRACDQLRAEVAQLKADSERSQKERAEIAQWFSTMMSEAASRLLVERRPA